jgi:hypothetical protein
MWLPTFIGQNYLVLKELGKAWEEKFPQGVQNTPEGLDEMHEFTIKWLCEKFPIEGLEPYLHAITNVKEPDDAVQQTAG